ncbi:MAG: hypothetical protein AAGE92_11705 [Cyanobacteria bacterium P01_G01_bin.4]
MTSKRLSSNPLFGIGLVLLSAVGLAAQNVVLRLFFSSKEAIARGLMARPRLLLLDEPSLGLAPQLVADLYRTLVKLRNERLTILLVDQMASLALAIADRAISWRRGRLCAQGQQESYEMIQ